MSRAAARIVLGGVAKVYCVHDREKRSELITEEFDPAILAPEVCICCENIYLQKKGDYERHGMPLCDICRGPLVHQPGAVLPWEGDSNG